MTDLDLLRQHLLGLGKVLLGYSGGVDSALLAVVGEPGARRRAVPGRDRPERVLSRGAVAHRRGAGRAVRRAAARAGHPRARRSPLPPQRHRPLLLLQVRAVDPPRRSRSPAGLRHHHRRHQRRRPRRAPARARARDGSAESARRWRSSGGARTRCGRRPGSWGFPPGTRPPRPVCRAGCATGSRSRPERLRQVEEGEAFLRSLGVAGDLRVRHHGRHASVEVAPERDDAAAIAAGRSVGRFFAGLGFDDGGAGSRRAIAGDGCWRWRPHGAA